MQPLLIISIIVMLCIDSSTATVHRNCEDWRLHRHTDNGFYRVDPTESGSSFEVECDLSSNPARTIIHHDKESRTFYSRSVSGNYMTLDVTYWIFLDQIDAVKTKSLSCSQYVKIECHREAIEFADNKVYWRGRHAEKYTYWGDVNGYSGYCECGLAGNCQYSGEKCECETSRNTWRYDDGHLVDMSALPLTQLRSDSLDSNSRGYHTIGPLICIDGDPRAWIETPAGVTVTLIITVLSFLSIVMISLTCYRRQLWKTISWKCRKKQSVTIVEPVGPAPRAVLAEKPPSPLTPDSVTLYSAFSKKPPMSPGIIPTDNYEPGTFLSKTPSRSFIDYRRKTPTHLGRRSGLQVMPASRMSYKTTINSPQPWEEGHGQFPWESYPPSRPPEYDSIQHNEFGEAYNANQTSNERPADF